jgi:hypothetical protein
MRKLRVLHRKTSLETKIGLPIAIFIILPLIIAITHKVLNTSNIIF